MQTVMGRYTGIGTAQGQTQKLTGFGFTPTFMMVQQQGGGSEPRCAIRTKTMPGTAYADCASPDRLFGTGAANGINYGGDAISFDADGCTLYHSALFSSLSLCTAGRKYVYLAVGGEGSDFTTFSYTGTGGNTSRAFSSVGFDPDLVMIFADSPNSVNHGYGSPHMWDFILLPDTQKTAVKDFGSGGNFRYPRERGFDVFNAGGFTVNSSATQRSFNEAGTPFHVACFKNSANFFCSYYYGDATSGRHISTGFPPCFVLTSMVEIALGAFGGTGPGPNVMRWFFDSQCREMQGNTAEPQAISALDSSGFVLSRTHLVNGDLAEEAAAEGDDEPDEFLYFGFQADELLQHATLTPVQIEYRFPSFQQIFPVARRLKPHGAIIG
jgi:hypothetical protein